MTIRCEVCGEEWFLGHMCPQIEQDVEIKSTIFDSKSIKARCEMCSKMRCTWHGFAGDCPDLPPLNAERSVAGLDKNVTPGELREEEERIKQYIADLIGSPVEGCTCSGCLQAVIDQQAKQIKQYQELHETMKAKVIQADETTAKVICRLNELLCDIVNI